MIHPSRFKPVEDPENAGYVYNPDLIRAIKVALATERPLLLRGKPGTGKTTLAKDVARILAAEGDGPLGADYYQEVITSRTEARDLEWRFDAIHRLSETQLPEKRERVAIPANYVEPRALWWAFDPIDAEKRGGGADTNARDPLHPERSNAQRPAVVLIDEIDKAEPEVANDLLEPFDVKGFRVAETGHPVGAKRDVFLIVTTNDERDLPSAFLRRCVPFELKRPGEDVLKKIARSHLKTELENAGVAAMIKRVEALAAEAREQRVREPGIAEFLDALRAVKVLEPGADNDEWNAITRLALWKHPSKDQ